MKAGEVTMGRTGFQLTQRRDNESAYRQFFGNDSRIPEMRAPAWADRLALAWSKRLTDRRSKQERPD